MDVKIYDLETKVLRSFDPTRYMDFYDGSYAFINKCDPVQLLVQGFTKNADLASFNKMGEYIQVWNQIDDMMMLDLNRADPTPVAELGHPKAFARADNYIATGFRPSIYTAYTKSWLFLDQTRFGNIVLRSVA